MVKLITGGLGTGKTKRMIEMANDLAAQEKGNVVYIDDDSRHMYDLKHQVRFISLHEYPINDKKGLIGFLCGVISEDHDIQTILIDGLMKIGNIHMDDLICVLKEIKTLSQRFDIDFILSISCNAYDLPEELKEYTVA
jgi:thymidine kinase